MWRTNTVTRHASASLIYSSSQDDSSLVRKTWRKIIPNPRNKNNRNEDPGESPCCCFLVCYATTSPEDSLAVVASTVESKQLGVTVAIGILIHNIPEGIAIAVPCIAARPEAWPLGFLKYGRLPLENVLACVAGIMCMVAVLELYLEWNSPSSLSSRSIFPYR
jgi:ZIP family zinc transporter